MNRSSFANISQTLAKDHMPVSGDADSTTKSAISNGTIEVRSNPKQNLNQLNRDTENALNALGKIFDKEIVKEKQELANLFGQEAYKAVGDLAEKQWEKATTKEEKAKWAEGGEYKILLHTVVGGIMSELGGNGFTSGAVGAGVTQALQKELANIKDPNLRLIASSIVGATASKLVGGNGKVGGSTAYTGTLYNDYVHHPTTPGAIIYRENDENGEGRGYYKVQSDGDEEYLNNGVKPGDVFWVADGKYIDGKQMGNEWIVGDNGSPIAFSWTPVQIPVGGTLYNNYITIDIAVNQETGKEVVINGRTVMSPDSSTRYNDAVAKYEESMKVPELIAGFVNPEGRIVSATEEIIAARETLLESVSNQKLKNAIGQIYRPGASIGDGGLADAIRYELTTGELVGGKSHIQKGIERVKNLENILAKEILSQEDKEIAEKLLCELQEALKGVTP